MIIRSLLLLIGIIFWLEVFSWEKKVIKYYLFELILITTLSELILKANWLNTLSIA